VLECERFRLRGQSPRICREYNSAHLRTSIVAAEPGAVCIEPESRHALAWAIADLTRLEVVSALRRSRSDAGRVAEENREMWRRSRCVWFRRIRRVDIAVAESYVMIWIRHGVDWRRLSDIRVVLVGGCEVGKIVEVDREVAVLTTACAWRGCGRGRRKGLSGGGFGAHAAGEQRGLRGRV